MTKDEMRQLEEAIDQMMEIARDFGLDFYDMRFEICPADVLYTFGAYAMPTRFSHWSFGKAFHKMKMQYDFGLSRIYELVFNSNPCYAFLLDGNSLIQNKLVSAHVLAHCDFFKNNAMFAGTSRYMIESMSVSADRIRSYEIEFGKQVVEDLLDAGMAIQEHIDPMYARRSRPRQLDEGWALPAPNLKKSGPYDDLWELDPNVRTKQDKDKGQKDGAMKANNKFPKHAEKDVMLFVIEHSKALQEWERDVLSILRDEMLYFWPQIETKIMNEGWATYWHLRIMREMDFTDEETIEFAKMHSGVIAPSRTSINPYTLGLYMWEAIEKRYNQPTQEERERFGLEPGKGREKMFEIREMESDISFLRNYLTKDLVDELDLYLYQKVGNEWKIVDKDWEHVRDQLCAARVNGGFPVLYVEDGDYNGNGELYIKHQFEGLELDVKYLEKTIPYLHRLWGRNVHIETVLENRHVLFTHDGKKTSRRFL
jgi:stage V sporulation protein R